MPRVRVRFSKLGKVRWTSHRDVARVWERALRRADLPVVTTEGFSPRPRVSFGLALPTGAESLAEYLDVDLVDEGVDPAGLPDRLSGALPIGFAAQAAAPIGPREPSLQHDVTSCSWRFEIAGLDEQEARDAVARTLAAGEIPTRRTRKGQESTDDIRPAIRRLEVVDAAGGRVTVEAELLTQPRGLRPAELLAACLPQGEAVRIVRTHQWIERDGARREPLPLAATSARAPARTGA